MVIINYNNGTPPLGALPESKPFQDNFTVLSNAASLYAIEQSSPNLTVYVREGLYYVDGTQVLQFLGGPSPSINAVSGGTPTQQRYALLTIDHLFNMSWVYGAWVTPPSVPAYPSVPANIIPVCLVLITYGMTAITSDLILDTRPLLNLGGGGSGAGATGIQGDTGLQGITGAIGNTGVQGTTGIQGQTGVRGQTGFQGQTGVGIQGSTGAGIQGATGIQGQTGVAGLQGQTGVQGQTGFQGTTGTQGSQGQTGTQGITGLQGQTGAQGLQGNTGTQGSTGSQGQTGTSGAASATLQSAYNNGQTISGSLPITFTIGETGVAGPGGVRLVTLSTAFASAPALDVSQGYLIPSSGNSSIALFRQSSSSGGLPIIKVIEEGGGSGGGSGTGVIDVQATRSVNQAVLLHLEQKATNANAAAYCLLIDNSSTATPAVVINQANTSGSHTTSLITVNDTGTGNAGSLLVINNSGTGNALQITHSASNGTSMSITRQGAAGNVVNINQNSTSGTGNVLTLTQSGSGKGVRIIAATTSADTSLQVDHSGASTAFSVTQSNTRSSAALIQNLGSNACLVLHAYGNSAALQITQDDTEDSIVTNGDIRCQQLILSEGAAHNIAIANNGSIQFRENTGTNYYIALTLDTANALTLGNSTRDWATHIVSGNAAIDFSTNGTTRLTIAANGQISSTQSSSASSVIVNQVHTGSSVAVSINNSGSGPALVLNNTSTTGSPLRIPTLRTVTNSTDPGTTGDICVDGTYIYWCVAPNTWKRALGSTW